MATIESLAADHIALAMVLLKHKPEGIDLEDYFSALRLSSSVRPNGSTEMLDGSNLWSLLFSQLQRQCLDMRAELITLRPIEESCTNDQNVGEKGRKRTLDAYAPNKANTQSKRRKTERSVLFENVPDAIQGVVQHRDRSLLLRIMFGLARHPQGSPAQPDGLAHLICLACEAMFEGLENAIDTSTALQAPAGEPLLLNEICAAIQHIWASTVLRLETHSAIPGAEVDCNMILPQMCPVIQSLLQHLHSYCLDEALVLVKTTKKDKRTRIPNFVSIMDRNAKRTELFEHNCNVVTRCLAHVLHKSNDLQAVNEHAFQALAAIFLEHLGSSVSFRVFVDPGSKNVEGGLLPPRGLSDTIDTDQKVAVQAAKLEAPHLIEILTALMRHKNQKHQSMEQFRLLRNLQESLLRGMFEERVGADPHTGINNNLASPQASDDNEADEFLSQVWDILGWDIILDKAQTEFRRSV